MKPGILEDIRNAAATAHYLARPKCPGPSTEDDFERNKRAQERISDLVFFAAGQGYGAKMLKEAIYEGTGDIVD
jgi:hypothetical protein